MSYPDPRAETECGSQSPEYGWNCTRGAHDDPVHIAGTGEVPNLLAIWTDNEAIAEKEPGKDHWIGAWW